MTTTSAALSRPLTITSWVLQVIVAAIFAMAAVSKLVGAEESRHIFTVMGMEPYGRHLVGGTELAAVVLILIPWTVPVGGLLAALVMLGAIGSHLTKLGVSVTMADGSTDGGAMFSMAVIALIAASGVVIIRRRQLPMLRSKPKPDAPTPPQA